jgi:hypothetical protein
MPPSGSPDISSAPPSASVSSASSITAMPDSSGRIRDVASTATSPQRGHSSASDRPTVPDSGSGTWSSTHSCRCPGRCARAASASNAATACPFACSSASGGVPGCSCLSSAWWLASRRAGACASIQNTPPGKRDR